MFYSQLQLIGRFRRLGEASGRRVGLISLCGVLLFLALSGCAGWKVTDPVGALGRWKSQPAQQPILQTLSAAEEAVDQDFANAEDPTPEDLQVIAEDYPVGPGDTIDIQIFELLRPDTPQGERVMVDDLGFINITYVGQIKAEGLTAVELIERIKEILYPNILKDPQVTVTVLTKMHRTFSIIGAVREPQRYRLEKADFRLLQALAQARDIYNTNIPYVYVLRRPLASELIESIEGEEAKLEDSLQAEPAKLAPPQLSPEEDLEELLKAIPGKSVEDDNANTPNVLHFSDMASGSSSRKQAGRERHKGFDFSTVSSGKKLPFAGRVIKIPLADLRAGNANYDVVIRNNDVIHVPLPEFGFYYMMGNVNRPGAYQLGTTPVTLTQAIAGAGSLGALAAPSKVDITRRIGEHKQQIVQVDLAKIFAGIQPDYYIKNNDTINVGTSPVSPWMAIIRNGFRATYGFGFVYDRNYADRDQFRPFELPNLLFW